MQELRGRVAVVTGGGSGIGRGLCQAFAEEGMQVVVADIELGAAQETVQLLGGKVRALAVQSDVASPASVEALAGRVVSELGGVHLLCNNAGVLVNKPAVETTWEDLRWTLSVNIEGVANGVRAFVPRMRAQGGEAHIVNTSSIAGMAPLDSQGLAAYSASKAAVAAFSEVLRRELEPERIGVSVLLPGRVPTTRISQAARNRPAELGGPAPADPAQTARRAAIAELKTMEPIEVARKVVLGVRANRLYILADPERRNAPEGRHRRMSEDFDASAAEARTR